MGLLKFTLGLIPFFFSYLISKKLIILLSVGTACACCWSLIAATTILSLNDSIVVTVMGLMVTASMDPTWKISHLYSVELFPTAVRNMARGACNVTARLGSMSGPLIILMRSVNPSLPYWLFAVLLTLQWLVLALFMPSKSADELPESMPNRSKKELKLLENA
ncbi:unnamed protein product [Bursaphelenchus okinawaensis]|nr:unnamed protein product [Bursaphelenchus okinawaensis]CAG9127825.1 unnamed protein product [Bursaphelenchus okinawaensis]